MEAALLTVVESALRVALGLRFLASGLSNVRRWPSAVDNARLVFPFGATFFGFIAVFLMIAGGLGLVFGFQTRVAALMIVLFLIPTLKIQWHWLKTLPATIEELGRALAAEEHKSKFRRLAWHAYHAHETGWQNNLLFMIVALFYSVRGATALALDLYLR